VELAAKTLLALLALALFVQLVKHGPGGAGAWLRAWFLGKAA
jgi:hypothetical protein